jgi:hypothetical protein
MMRTAIGKRLLILLPVAAGLIVLYILLAAVLRIILLVLAAIGVIALFDAKGVLRYPGLAWRRVVKFLVTLGAAYPFRLVLGRRTPKAHATREAFRHR